VYVPGVPKRDVHALPEEWYCASNLSSDFSNIEKQFQDRISPKQQVYQELTQGRSAERKRHGTPSLPSMLPIGNNPATSPGYGRERPRTIRLCRLICRA